MPILLKSAATVTATVTPTKTTTTEKSNIEINTASKSKNGKLSSTSTFDDLLNSFQQETTTTRRPQLTTFSDADDIAFLKGLVRTLNFVF